ncbi:MAG: type IX secretion system sortase PorU [Bacteroidia bacterium]|nr:type IX secretion system sortase PorU [Bacteroidia bacterium]
MNSINKIIYKQATCLVVAFLLIIMFANAQNRISMGVDENAIILNNWTVRTLFNNVETRKVLSFDGAVSDELQPDLPYYLGNTELGNVIITIKNEQYTTLTTEESLLVKSKLSNLFEVTYYSSYIKKQAHTFYKINALRKNLQSNSIERLTSFEMVKTPATNADKIFAFAPRTYTSTSVLATGNFIKYMTADNGVYKLTYTELKKRGIDVNNINPQNIKIFSNGGAILPLANVTYRPDDLLENAIFVAGENDGKFDSLDYVLFYGQKPSRWITNTTASCKKRKLCYQQNIWADSTAYFITVTSSSGKRIGINTNNLGVPTHSLSTYYNALQHEKDLINVMNSGKEFFGEQFNTLLTYNYALDLPNVTQDSIALVISAGARYISSAANASTSIIASANGVDVATIALPAIPNYASQQYLNEIILPKEVCKVIADQPTKTALQLTYVKKNDSYAYLNKFELHFRSNLKLDKAQNWFRNIDSIGTNRVIELLAQDVKNNTIVWDVTDASNVFATPYTLQGINASLIIDGSKNREFIAYDGSMFLVPKFSENVVNQNLHGITQADMIIVAHPKFYADALTIGTLHTTYDTLKTVVVTTTQLYNEFGGGHKDIIAIKDFIKMLYDRNTGAKIPRYVLLFGDASYNRILNPELNSDYIPSFESDNSHHPVETYVTDDYFVTLDDGEGVSVNDKVDVSIGRFPVKNDAESKAILNKISKYLSKDSYYEASQNTTIVPGKTAYGMGDWRNTICMVADDEDNSAYLDGSETLSKKIEKTNPAYNVDKVYIDAYTQTSTAGGQLYPDVNEAINRRMEKGCLIINYTGHGGEVGWSGERILDNSMILAWKNINNLPFFVTATCEFARYDDPARNAAGELVLLSPNGGGIGLLTTTRPVYEYANLLLNTAFYTEIFKVTNGQYPRLGDAMIPIKNTADNFRANNRKFCLLGDPALRLAYPKQSTITDSVNGRKLVTTSSVIIDTVQALSKLKVKGYVVDGITGVKISNYNGYMYPTVYDKAIVARSLSNDASSIARNFKLQKNIVYKGIVSITNGNFEFECMIPKDIIQDTGRAKISYYYENGVSDGAGYDNHVWLNGINTNAAVDNNGPEIKLYMNDYKFVDEGLTNDKPLLLAKLFDENGINTVGTGLGHDITGIIDEQSNKKVIMNDYYNSEINSYQRGIVSYPLNKLTEGHHTLRLKAFDTYNNSNEQLVNFIVAGSEKVALEHVFNYPNPFTTHTSFYLEHNKPFSQLNVQLQIFTITGKIVKSFDLILPTAGTRVGPIDWDGKDEYGDQLAKGVYIYKVKLRSANGDMVEKFEKLVILK